MRYGTRYGSRIARDMTAGPPGGVPSVLTERARDEGIARMIAAGYARQEAAKEAEAARAYAEANRLTPAQQRAASEAKFMAQAKHRAEVKKATRQWEAQHGTPTGIPERVPGSLERGRALYVDQQRRRG